MKRYSTSLIKTIRHERKLLKISYKKLSDKYQVPFPTIRNWCRDLGILKNESLLAHHQLLRKDLKHSELKVVPHWRSISMEQLKFLSALLYGCEGAKYPATKALCFTNSEPKLVQTFYNMLSNSFELDKNKITIRLQVHKSQKYNKIKNFWSNLLGIPKNQFLKPTVTEPRNRKHHKDYQGTCTLKYQDYRLQLKLLGIFEEFVNRAVLLK